VLERRRSRRRHGEPPLSARQLGELLYRSARAGPVTDGGEYEVARRPYPGGGGAWELEVYPLVSRCQGLEPGLFHYRPGEHRLTRLAAAAADLDRLLTGAARATHREEPPQVLLLLAARFGRLSYKYSSMAYATVLKDVGVLMQTFYLVGTAMGLAVCAVGGGDSDRFAAASGLSYYAQGTVGELVVGRAAADEDEP
jgi:SagB-type dehydrogenase family enzyme